ncbi:RmlC-like cupin domain-containing protein [Dioszegia hungarica]|uniref:RmlC-like cupin domain-containing protein n=1 Tax=Dioszegia hungarica TaxID=4972 RepID=A0AA38HB70_9TREE|nr:RmlC-like cupin domain-containing protein [Dioszegia hungarica]KAI9637012.1 RmlC-like cupin domain-containing protein [Dioszegia hungarica]
MSVLHVPGASLQQSGGQTEGMSRKNAIMDKSDQLCSSIMLAKPHSSSGIHHHATQDTIIYAIRGNGSISFADGRERVDLKPGDWALIPANVEHKEMNDGDEEVEWVIVRGGRVAAVENVDGWKGA